jgi:hypothetical protein
MFMLTIPFYFAPEPNTGLNRSVSLFWPNWTRKWNQPILVEWNHYIQFHFVSEPTTPLDKVRSIPIRWLFNFRSNLICWSWGYCLLCCFYMRGKHGLQKMELLSLAVGTLSAVLYTIQWWWSIQIGNYFAGWKSWKTGISIIYTFKKRAVSKTTASHWSIFGQSGPWL